VDDRDFDDFSAAIAGKDADVDLFGAAMVIARLRGEPVDPNAVARELDLIAEAAHDRAGDATDVDSLSQAIDHELFVTRGFHGNSETYQDPANSYLDQVVERRTGLPILLSLVYMEVAQRIGLRCDGVGFPGHFMVRCGDPARPIFIDPFHQGVRVDEQELLARLRGQPLGTATPESFLAGVTRRQVLQRMLRNLHALFRDARDFERWLSAVELLLRLEPWNAALVGERGMLHYRLGAPELALFDLKRYVEANGAVSAGARRLLQELELRHAQDEGIA
jgi:regulator of sirC expression with transglutaminase-like and TPR domain